MNLPRYPAEQPILAVTVLILLVALALTAGFSVCLIPLAVLLFVLFMYQMNLSQHQAVIRHARVVTPKSTPELFELAKGCARKLHPPTFKVYVLPSNQRNAYTFGLSDPRVVVVYSSLLKIMDPDELRFVIGHELGHLAFNHTWLNTLLGGMAGVPVSMGAAVVLIFAFRWWNRACEFSADRAGLLACGDLNKAISALVKLVAGEVRNPGELQHALQAIDAEDDSFLNVLASSLSTHPMAVKRIQELRKFAASSEYRRAAKKIAREASAPAAKN